MGLHIGTSLEGVTDLVPPPGAETAGFGFKSLKRGLKRVGKGVVKAHTMPLKKGLKVTRKVHRVTTKAVKKLPGGKLAVKLANAPIKIAAGALKATAKLAARPIISVVNKLAGRRANLLAYQRTGVAKATAADKKAGGRWALGKVAKYGPMGKLAVRILKYTGGVTSGEGDNVLGLDETHSATGWREDAASCGMAPAAIAAVAVSVTTAITGLIKALNKPGQAPANPAASAAAPATEAPAEETAAPAEEAPAEEPADETEGILDGILGAYPTMPKGLSLDAQIAWVQENMPSNHALLKKLAAKWRRLHPNEDDSSMGDDRERIAGIVRKKLRRRKIGRVLRAMIAKRKGLTPPLPPPPPGRRGRRHF